MKNPLLKRLPREIFGEFGKYLAVFLFMTVTIAFISGFLVASRSMQITYDESFERYHIEDGHFVLAKKAEDKLIKAVEKKKVTLYEDFYIEEEVSKKKDEKTEAKFRIFGSREEINRICLMDGKMPEKDDEIGIDRMFADNNELKTGDTIFVGGRKFQISGLIAMSDYSALYQDNNDFMFDAKLFGTAAVTDEVFESFGKDHLFYSYAWKYDTFPKDEIEEKEVSEKLSEEITKNLSSQEMVSSSSLSGDGGTDMSAESLMQMMVAGDMYSNGILESNVGLDIFLPRFVNKALNFTGDDLGHDRPMMTVLLYVLIAIMAFVFAVTINHTVAKEATVIGTLRASGYTKGEIFRHYLAPPVFVSFLAAIAGNILGYTMFEEVARAMYMASYTLTKYVSYWSAEAFVKTTVVPMIIIFIITSVSLWKKLSISPLRFIRRDISKNKGKKAMRLPHFSFFTRFRIRIILQNMSSYLTLLVGFVFSALILMFGMIMTPLLHKYSDDAVKYMPAKYQYVLSGTSKVDSEIAEKYCVTALKMQDDFYDGEEEISVYGLIPDSKYYEMKMPENGVVVTSDFSTKYRAGVGDIINLKEQFGTKLYAFRISGIMEYPSSLALFMSQENFNKTFSFPKDYYNGYFSNTKLEGKYIRETKIANCITITDLTMLSRQMDISMGEMFGMVKWFAIILFILLIYLLTKLILEKNSNAISMVKILGYSTGEIGRLYLIASVWVVIFSALFSLIFNTFFFQIILRVFLKGYGGWFNLTVDLGLYATMFAMMVGTYLVVALIQLLKIRKIPMDEALKNVE
ncbi:MAG: ABC transporter permease [Lachnospiraceae bacterium]|nr:ABC transporter permease [Lachnospiraceae bacterium]